MKWLVFMIFVLISSYQEAIAGSELIKTPVEITSVVSKGDRTHVLVSVSGATAASQLVVFTRFSNRPNLSVATDEFQEPVLPRTGDALPSSGSFGTSLSTSRWSIVFKSDQEWGRLQEIFAVVCTVGEHQDWSRSKDYQGFKYLPFERTENISDALNILANFGWVPTGYTRFP